MTTTRVNGQSIEEFIPLDLRREFYHNSDPVNKYQISNGLDPYGFTTDGLVLYLPLWALKEDSFKSVDTYGHTCTVTGALWRPDGRIFDTDDRVVVTKHDSLHFAAADAWSMAAWVKGDSSNKANSNSIFDCRTTKGYVLLTTASTGTMRTFYGGVGNTGSINIMDDNPHYIEFLKEAGTSGLLHIRVDAVEDDTPVSADGTGLADDLDVYIGTRQNLSGDYKGLIGEAWIHNRYLSVAESIHNMQATEWRFQ